MRPVSTFFDIQLSSSRYYGVNDIFHVAMLEVFKELVHTI